MTTEIAIYILIFFGIIHLIPIIYALYKAVFFAEEFAVYKRAVEIITNTNVLLENSLEGKENEKHSLTDN